MTTTVELAAILIVIVLIIGVFIGYGMGRHDLRVDSELYHKNDECLDYGALVDALKTDTWPDETIEWECPDPDAPSVEENEEVERKAA